MRWLKKKDVPEELPNLALDDAIKKSESEAKAPPTEKSPEIEPPKDSKVQKLPSTTQESLSGKGAPPIDDEHGYFKEIIKSVTEEIKDLDRVDSWYKNKFLPEDIVFQMREYWEKQQPDILLKNIRGDLKDKLMEKINKLHRLEKEWQEIYFQLLAKEETIRKEEKDLKESLSEFIEIFRRSAKGKKNDSQEKNS